MSVIMDRHIEKLPEDLVADILSRLHTATDIGRLRRVSKSWNRLLSDPKFLHRTLFRKEPHEEKGGNTVTMITRISSPENPRRLLYSVLLPDPVPNDGLLQYRDIPMNWEETYGLPDIIGCCDGVFCVRRYTFQTDAEVLLWNPSTSETKWLPDCHYSSRYMSVRASGFGFDSSTGDYKVVRVSRGYNNDGPMVGVYSLMNDSWRLIVDDPEDSEDLRNCPGDRVFRMHNSSCQVVYWYESREVPNRWRSQQNTEVVKFLWYNWILCFDFRTEEFSTQNFPTGLAERVDECSGFCMAATRMEDSLVAVIRDSKENLEIWGLLSFRNAESWTRLFNCNLSWVSVDLPIGFLGNGEYVFVKGNNGGLLSFDFAEEKVGNDYGIRAVEEEKGTNVFKYGVAVYAYVPSSASIASMTGRARIEDR